jgi:hypothetical protein
MTRADVMLDLVIPGGAGLGLVAAVLLARRHVRGSGRAGRAVGVSSVVRVAACFYRSLFVAAGSPDE